MIGREKKLSNTALKHENADDDDDDDDYDDEVKENKKK